MLRDLTFSRIMFAAMALGFVAGSAFALMPPEVYVKAIESSPIKVIARVKSVKISEESKYYIEKKVEFVLIKSYGPVKPANVFYGSCKSSTTETIVGGTIFYYPNVGDEVFVTLDGVGDGDDSGYITSYTPVTDELKNILDNAGLYGLEYGIGKVSVKF